MSVYRKKPVEVEAMLFASPWGPVVDFCPDITLIKAADSNRIVFGNIDTLEGTMRAEVGDYIIKGVRGEFYPCKPEIFDDTYELVTVSEPHEPRPLTDTEWAEEHADDERLECEAGDDD